MRFCTYCGKQIADEAAICLNCGCKTQAGGNGVFSQTGVQPQQIIVEENESSLATWAKICGIVSFFTGFIIGIIAIILACMSKDDTNGIMCPSAKVGYVCGIISTVLYVALIVVIVLVVLLAI